MYWSKMLEMSYEIIDHESIDAINNLDYKVYANFWAEFWIERLGYNPAERKMTVKIMSLEQAKNEDEKLEREFVEFYKNKVSK